MPSLRWLPLLVLLLVPPELKCDVFNCPEGCECSKRNQMLFCDNLDLPKIKAEVAKSVSSLILKGLRRNYLDATVLKDYKNLANLQIVNGRISEIHKNTFSSLPKLQYLNLSDNEIVTVSPQTFANNTQLKKLVLAGNTLLFAGTGPILHSESLRFLDISRCSILSLRGESFTGLPNLLELDLRDNPIACLPAAITARGIEVRGWKGPCASNPLSPQATAKSFLAEEPKPRSPLASAASVSTEVPKSASPQASAVFVSTEAPKSASPLPTAPSVSAKVPMPSSPQAPVAPAEVLPLGFQASKTPQLLANSTTPQPPHRLPDPQPEKSYFIDPILIAYVSLVSVTMTISTFAIYKTVQLFRRKGQRQNQDNASYHHYERVNYSQIPHAARFSHVPLVAPKSVTRPDGQYYDSVGGRTTYDGYLIPDAPIYPGRAELRGAPSKAHRCPSQRAPGPPQPDVIGIPPVPPRPTQYIEDRNLPCLPPRPIYQRT